MTTKLVKWASNDGQIIKSGLSDGYGGKAITTAAHLDYDRHGFEGYPGNVGSFVSTNSPRRNPDAHYCDPAAIVADANRRFGSGFSIDHSYLQNDFLLVVRKNLRP